MNSPKIKCIYGKYEVGRTIGEGPSGKMKFARNVQTGEPVCLKILDKDKVLKLKLIEQITMEITTMKLIKHPNVVRLYEVMGSKTKIYMVFEYVTGGELFDKIVKLGRMRENEARKYFQQLINAVDCCHSRGVYHRDLKPENLLLDAFGNLKVSNFALSARSRQVRDDGLLHTTCGSPNYVAPEVLNNRGYDGATADLWSCGVILYVLLAGFLPFDDSSITNLYIKIMTADFTCPPWFSFSAMKLINRILDPNPMTRITISELKNNEWFSKDFKQKELMEIEETGSDGMEATFQKLEEYHLTEKKEEHLAAMNAFELITMSKGLNLGSLFDMEQGYRLEDILSATNNFSDENLIAEGALGKVYKGQLLQSGNLMNVAIRRFDCKYGKGDELQMEISMLKSLKHKYIASVFKRFDENNEKIIIYEQSFHGTLYQHLSDPTLTWTQRLQICLGVAHALDYIHYDVIHCDISSSKIFLDKDWEPKIYGFELSTTYPQSLRHRLLFSHYFDTSNMTPKYDVYSFGVLLFEVLCGKKPMITNEGVQEEVDQIIDPKLRKQMDSQSLALFTNIANNCLNQYLVQRPTMDQIVKELEDVFELQLKHANLEHSIAADAGTPSNNVKMEFLKISLSEIRLATNDFDESYSIGCGGYGVVYKAILDVLDIQSLSSMEGKHKDELPKISKTVAIKRIFNRADEQGKQGFLTEIELLTSCKHPNIQQASTIYTKNIAGTQVYMDPEYSTTFKYKRESDVYSFGVVLFEVLSGSLAYDPRYTCENDLGLAPIARRRFSEGTLKELIDPEIIQEDDDRIFTLNRGPNQDSFDTFSKIAYQCLAESQAKRPTMEVVVKELQKALNLQGDSMVISRFLLSDIVLATENFAEINCIGLDMNGEVYKAELEHFGINSLLETKGKNNGEPSNETRTVAIKRITNRTGVQGKQGFFSELEMRTSYKHPNIVSLLGFCDEGDELILVYEHASKRSLDDYLKNVNTMKSFSWTQRLHLCLKIAVGLNHLHTKMNNVHGDIRSANILLDENLEVKIAYFGISKLNPTNKEVRMEVYEDPEYQKRGKFSRETDIYSFGVILFEIFSWRLAYDSVYIGINDRGLAHIARQCINDGTIESLMDPKLKEDNDEDIFTSIGGPNQDSLITFLKIASKCLGKTVEHPTMETIIKELEIALHFHEILHKKLKMSLKNLASATENFDEKNCVQSGRFWKAYKGELLFPQDDTNTSGRTTIVAKRWVSNYSHGYHQFRTEVNALFKCKHENITGLIGYCNEMDEKIIVYEHMSNGSLDKCLKDAYLTWMKRLKICIDVASGLEFLHQGGVAIKKVVHRGIKSSSILLNNDWKAKISNMELASLDSLHQNMEHVNDSAYDAFGYLDPLYKQGFLAEESDIYSLGVVLFEILCGRLACAEGCKDHSQSLGPLAKRCYEEGKLDDIVFDGIKEQIGPESLATFANIAYRCLLDKSEERPKAREVVMHLKKVLDVQEDYEVWEAELPKDYKDIIKMSKTPEIYSTAKRKDLYNTLSKGILIQEGKVWFSLGSNGERNEMVSASQFSYNNHQTHTWRSVRESRFDKIAEMSDISHLNINIKIRSRSLSPGVNYGVHLVFKFCGARKSVAKRMYVNLTYKMGNETLHAYFATWQEDEWMTIELYRFLNHKELDTTELEFLLESFSRFYCRKRGIYIEGVELRAVDNASFTVLLICSFVLYIMVYLLRLIELGVDIFLQKRHEENDDVMEVQQVNMDPMQQMPTVDVPFDICSVFTQTILKLFSWRNNEKQHYMLSANDAFCDPFNAGRFTLKTLTKSRFQKVIELLSTHVFIIKCDIKSQLLLQNTEYVCYLVFKLSEKCCGLHCPVIVRDLRKRRNKQTEVAYFRSPSLWNINDVTRLPQERKDGWMEVCVWKFKSNYDLLQNNCISINLKFVSYEGTMSGLIVSGLEFRPV
ncbi:hypothetical protein R6Q57_010942 [Mikania cordata]